MLVTTWGHDPTSVFVSNLLLTVNDALTHSSVLIQVTMQWLSTCSLDVEDKI